MFNFIKKKSRSIDYSSLNDGEWLLTNGENNGKPLFLR